MRLLCFPGLSPLVLVGLSLCTHPALLAQTPQRPGTGQPGPAGQGIPGQTGKDKTPAPAPPKADEAATKTITAALDQLDPRKSGALQMMVWQKVESNGMSFVSEGRCLIAPDYRVHTQLNVKAGDEVAGSYETISDGSTLWTIGKAGSAAATITKVNLKKLMEVLNAPGSPPGFKEEVLRRDSLFGVLPIFQNMKNQMTFTSQEAAQWKGHEVWVVHGTWQDPAAQTSTNWRPYMPRTCKVYVDKATSWPQRIEWLGPTPQGPETILIQMEFRDVQKVKPVDREFVFNPGNAEVVDETQRRLEQLSPGRASGR